MTLSAEDREVSDQVPFEVLDVKQAMESVTNGDLHKALLICIIEWNCASTVPDAVINRLCPAIRKNDPFDQTLCHTILTHWGEENGAMNGQLTAQYDQLLSEYRRWYPDESANKGANVEKKHTPVPLGRQRSKAQIHTIFNVSPNPSNGNDSGRKKRTIEPSRPRLAEPPTPNQQHYYLSRLRLSDGEMPEPRSERTRGKWPSKRPDQPPSPTHLYHGVTAVAVLEAHEFAIGKLSGEYSGRRGKGKSKGDYLFEILENYEEKLHLQLPRKGGLVSRVHALLDFFQRLPEEDGQRTKLALPADVEKVMVNFVCNAQRLK